MVVAVEVGDGPPGEDRDGFARVLECSVRAESGRLVLTSPTYGEDDGDRVDVPAGWLRLRISLADVPRARVQCWPGPARPARRGVPLRPPGV